MRPFLSFIFVFVLFRTVFAQCPDPYLMDQSLTRPSKNPTYINKIESSADQDWFNLQIYSPYDVFNYTIDFGDGHIETGGLWQAGTPVNHLYPIGKFQLKLSESKNGCTRSIIATVINDRKPGATAIPPTVNASGCTPHSLTFVNQSTNVSPFTRFIWDWGDGTKEVKDASSVGQPITHTFIKGKGGCNKRVTLTAVSLCDSSFSIFGPYDFWDVDNTSVKASSVFICGGDIVSFYDSTKYNCNSSPRYIQWDFTKAGGEKSAWLPATPQNKIQRSFINGNIGDKFSVTLSDSNICGVKTSSIDVTLMNAPKAIITSSNNTVCVATTIKFSNLSTGGANLFHYDFGDGKGWKTYNDKRDINYIYNQAGSFTVRLVAEIKGAPQCADTTSLVINVLSSPDPSFELSRREGCGQMQVHINNKSEFANEWKWYLNNALISEAKFPEPLTFENTGVYEIRLKTKSVAGCERERSTTVSLFPEVITNGLIDSACVGFPVKLADASSLINPASGTGSLLREQFDSLAINFAYTPIASLSGVAENSNMISLFESKNNAGTNFITRISGYIHAPVSGNYNFWIAADTTAELWLSTDDNPSNVRRIAFLSAGSNERQWERFATQKSSTIKLEKDKKYFVQVVHFKAEVKTDLVSVGWVIPGGIHNRPISGQYLSPYMEGHKINSWEWSINEGEQIYKDSNFTVTFANPGVQKIELSSGSGKCLNRREYTITAKPSPIARFDFIDTAGCSPLNIKVVNSGSIFHNATITFGDGSSAVNFNPSTDTISHRLVNNSGAIRRFKVKIEVRNTEGCTDSLIRFITVYPGPEADFSISYPSSLCSPLNLIISNTSKGGNKFLWQLNSNQAFENNFNSFSYNFVNKSGTVKTDTLWLKAFVNNSCYTEMYKLITVLPEGGVEIISDSAVCHNQTGLFSTSAPVISAQWTFDQNTKSNNLIATATFTNNENAASIKRIRLDYTSVFGCVNTSYRDILVHPKPVSDFMVSEFSGCSPLNVSLEAFNKKGSEYIWNLNSSRSISKDPTANVYVHNKTDHTSEIPVTLVVSSDNGCKDSTTKHLTIYPTTTSKINQSAFEGCSPFSVNFSTESKAGIKHLWDVGEEKYHEGSATEYKFQTDEDKNFQVKLFTVNNHGCIDTIYTEVNVKGMVRPAIVMDRDRIQPGETVVFHNETEIKSGMLLWEFGNGKAEVSNEIVTNQYELSGIYDVKLTVVNNTCADSTKAKVYVANGSAIAEFSGGGSGCGSLTVRFKNNSQNAIRYIWDFGDGETLEVNSRSDVVHTYTNRSGSKQEYNVTLTAIGIHGDGIKTVQSAVILHSFPKLSFYPASSVVYVPGEISFVNQSRNVAIVSWDFGDGNKSDQMNPKNFYKDPGLYTVTLIGKSKEGCSDTLVLNGVLEGKQKGRIILPNAFTPSLYPSESSEGLNDYFLPAYHNGVTGFHMMIFNKWGELLFESNDINKGWDGHYKGQLCPEDVYVYRVKVKYFDGTDQILTGDLTLLKL